MDKNNTKKYLGIKILIVLIIAIIALWINANVALAAETDVIKDEKTFVKMTVNLSRATDLNNQVKLSTLQESLNMYAGHKYRATVTEKSSTTLLVTFGATNNTYEIKMDTGAILYKITYDANGGSGAPKEQTKYEGVDIALSSTIPTRTNYTFLGWSTSSTATEATYRTGEIYKEDLNTTLYAVWGLNIVPVTYYVDTNTTYTEDVTVGKTVLSPTTFTPTKSGWTFVGWREDTTASGTVLTKKTQGEDAIILYAVYKQTVTVTYKGNGSTSGSTSSHTGTRYYNAAGNTVNPSFTLKSNGFTKTNYSFVKWAKGSKTGTQYAAGTSIKLSADTKFYAIWKAKTSSSTVTYSGETGSFGVESIGINVYRVKYDKMFTTIPTPTIKETGGYLNYQIIEKTQAGFAVRFYNGYDHKQWGEATWSVKGTVYQPTDLCLTGEESRGPMDSGSTHTVEVVYDKAFNKKPKLYVANAATVYGCKVTVTEQSKTGFTATITNTSSTQQWDTIYWTAVNADYVP